MCEGWFLGEYYDQEEFRRFSSSSFVDAGRSILENVAVNRTAYVLLNSSCSDINDGREISSRIDSYSVSGLDVSLASELTVVGNRSEGALILMVRKWGYDENKIQSSVKASCNNER